MRSHGSSRIQKLFSVVVVVALTSAQAVMPGCAMGMDGPEAIASSETAPHSSHDDHGTDATQHHGDSHSDSSHCVGTGSCVAVALDVRGVSGVQPIVIHSPLRPMGVEKAPSVNLSLQRRPPKRV